MTPCSQTIADPLTTADQYDLARALNQAAGNYRACQAQNDALINAVRTREAVTP